MGEKKTSSFAFLLILLLLSVLLLLSNSSTPPSDDAFALTTFRLQTDAHAALRSNWTGSNPCTWLGVSCFNSRVALLSLPSLSLRGPLDALSSLDQLRILDLRQNRLNGSISPLISLTNLKIVYLAGNDLSGQIPLQISSLHRLLRLDLSDNNLQGSIPPTFFNLTRLLTLRLENNALSGRVPDTLPKRLLDLNLSNNELSGQLPDDLLSKFGEVSFSGNKDLCGASPLAACSLLPGTSPATASSGIVTSIPAAPNQKLKRKGLRTGAIVAIVLANCVALLVIISFLIAYFCSGSSAAGPASRLGSEIAKQRRSGSSYGSEKKVYASNNESDETSATDRSKLVFYERRKEFELEDLLRASAEMLGKGSLGTVYRAVLDDGCTVVAVKRLKDANPCGKREFEQYMDLIGKMKHPNMVKLRAYYFAKEEKLLVYDFLPNGSLHSLLHANRGPGRIPLDWTTRISLVLGAARGLAKIHEDSRKSLTETSSPQTSCSTRTASPAYPISGSPSC
uniref:Protein kinase domain-containing protein n=1 Tax=Kalanchoe fedtschenkoi TaxID=63787 RepID=A0A7N0SYM5_KALFE